MYNSIKNVNGWQYRLIPLVLIGWQHVASELFTTNMLTNMFLTYEFCICTALWGSSDCL